MSKNRKVENKKARESQWKKKPEQRKRVDKETTEFEKGLADLKDEYGTNKLIAIGIGSFAGAVFLSGTLIQLFRNLIGAQDAVTLTGLIPTALLSVPGLILTALLTVGFIRTAHRMHRRYRKQYHVDRDRNYQIDDRHIYGSADYQDELERERCFFRSEDPLKVHHNLYILGEGIEDKLLYSIRDDLVSMNGHVAVFGSSGAGKSAALVKGMIYQALRQGKSLVVTDSKGDLYADTAKLAKKYGYEVKMLNLKSDELKNSDGCDMLKTLKDDDIKAGVLADTIIRNTEGSPNLDYWAKNELNALKAFLLYVSTNKGMIKAGKNKLCDVYDLITSKSLDEIHEMFGLLDDEHPAKSAYNIFSQAEPKIQGQIINGLGIRLSVLGNHWAKHVVSSDEIDLLGPMKRKCIYYVVISDMDETFKFIATLFFSLLFIEMCSYYDKTSQKCRKEGKDVPLLPVDFILDEYANTGAINAMAQKISTVRSRQIGITIILQDKGQLDEMYGENTANTILNNIPVKMLLKTTDFGTAKYFSDLMGIQTVRVENRRYEETSSQIFHPKDSYAVSEGVGKRQLENPDELINSLDANHLILLISGFHPVKLKKYLHSRHPMSKECEPCVPSEHVPKWRKAMIEKERAKGNTGKEQSGEDSPKEVPKNGPGGTNPKKPQTPRKKREPIEGEAVPAEASQPAAHIFEEPEELFPED